MKRASGDAPSLEPYTSPITVQTLHDPDIQFNPNNYYVMHVLKFKPNDKVGSWINLDWLEYNRIDFPVQEQEDTLKHLKGITLSDGGKDDRLYDRLKYILDSLHLKELDGHVRWVSSIAPASFTSVFDRKISGGFTSLMHNIRGRAAAAKLFESLFLNYPHMSVTNIGGRGGWGGGGAASPFEPSCKEVSFLMESPGPSPESCPRKDEEQHDQMEVQPTRRSVQNRRKRSLDEEFSTSPEPKQSRHFVPDIIVTNHTEQVPKEVLNVSVKSGFRLKEKDQNQLRFELLPVLLEKDSATGLLLCCGEAVLLNYKRTGDKSSVQRKKYTFENDSFDTFIQMLVDCLSLCV